MTRQVLFTPQRATEDDVLANASPGATAEFFITGTTTPVAIEDVDGNPLANPLTSNAAGVFPQVVYLGSDQVKCVIKDADGGTLYTIDPCPLFDAAGSAAVSVTYSPNSYLPQTNVQAVIDELAAILQGQSSTISIKNGTVSSPGLPFASDPSTGIYRIDAGQIGFSSGGSGVARFNSGGLRFSVDGSASSPALAWFNNTNTGIFRPANNTVGITTNGAEALRVAPDGDVRIGQTSNASPGVGNTVVGTGVLSNGVLSISRADGSAVRANTNTTGTLVDFRRQGDLKGTVSVTASDATFVNLSDARRKENIVPAGDPGAIIDAIKVVEYDWISGDSHVQWGLIAQQVHEVLPEVVFEGGEDPAEKPWGYAADKLVPVLLREIQLLRQRVAALEAANE